PATSDLSEFPRPDLADAKHDAGPGAADRVVDGLRVRGQPPEGSPAGALYRRCLPRLHGSSAGLSLPAVWATGPGAANEALTFLSVGAARSVCVTWQQRRPGPLLRRLRRELWPAASWCGYR